MDDKSKQRRTKMKNYITTAAAFLGGGYGQAVKKE